MLKFTIKRILMFPVLFVLASILVFVLLNMSNVDPVLLMMPTDYTQEDYDATAKRFGLDKSRPVQYWNWLKGVFTGDLGLSYKTKMPVADDLWRRVPTSLKLAIITVICMIILGIPLGVMCAVKQYTFFDEAVNVCMKIIACVPGFWLGLMLMMLFSIKLRWLPIMGINSWKGWVLPVITLLLPFLANYVRQVRSSMLDCIRQDYVRTARAKGMSERRVIYWEALKNAMLPIITTTLGGVCALTGGAVVVEKVFTITGVGNAIVDSINARDMPMLLSCTMVLATLIIFMQIIIDICYALVDPRVKSAFVKEKKRKKVADESAAVKEG